MIRALILALALLGAALPAHAQMLLLGVNRPATASTTPTLDGLTASAVSAYAFVKLRAAYGGSAERVRRGSDNTEQDIGFTGNDLDTASLLSFCAATDCYLKTWYDQSGNGNDATQSTNAQQPRVVIAGALVTFNGVPSARYDASTGGSGVYNVIPAYKFASSGTNFSFFLAGSVDTTANHNSLYTDGNGFQNNGIYLQVTGTPPLLRFNRAGGVNNLQMGTTAASGAQMNVYAGVHAAANTFTGYRNGETGANNSTGAWLSGALASTMLGLYDNGAVSEATSLNGYISLHVAFATNIGSTDRTTFMDSVRTYLGAP